MEILLGLLLPGHLLMVTYGHPILEAPESIIGPWKGEVTIPCTYSPLKGYTQVLVKWLIQRGADPITIFLRDSSGDHIQQSKYRGRLHVSREVSGNVSLQLNTLEMDDRNHYTCEVTWQTPDGHQVVKDKITELRVQKLAVTKPTVTTGSGYGFTVPQGMRISLQCQASGSPPISYIWYKEQTNNQEPIKVADLDILLFKPAVVSDSGSYFCTAKGRVGSEQSSDIVKFVVKGTSEPLQNKTEAPTTMASPLKRSGLPIFAIILIISFCCVVVIIMAYVMLCRKTSQQEHIYEVSRVHASETSDSGESMRGSVFKSDCSSNEPASRAVGNDYSHEHCLGQEYQIISQVNGDYECLLYTVPPNYEIPATEGKNVN